MLSPKIIDLLEELKKENNLVIVEGIKDCKVLKSLGFDNILTISGKSLEEITEKTISIRPSKVTILTDFDEEGESMASHLTHFLSIHKINVDHNVRKKFRSLKIHKIEELNFFTKLMGDDQNGKISSIYYKIFNRSRIFSRRNSGKTRRDRSNIRSDGRSIRSRLRFERASKNR